MWIVSTLTPVLAVTVGIGVTAALVAWRERDEPGALPLVGMFVGQCVWVTFSLFKLQASSFDEKILWSELAWIGVVLIPVAWLLFSMEYTGRDQYLQPRYIAILSIIPCLTVALALTSESHDLLYTSSEFVTYRGQILLNRTIGPWVWVVMGYTYLLGVLGSIPLLNLVKSEATTFRWQSGAILFGILVPWVSNALYLGGVLSIPAVDPTPIAFLISGLVFLGSVTRFRLFDTTPSAGHHARKMFIDQLREGAIVLDNHGFVVDINDSAARILGADRQQALGRPADDILPQLESTTNASLSQTIRSDHSDRLYDVTRTEITDSRGRDVGQILTLHDISDHVRDQQRHRVLNRVFRHNIRTETSLIVSYAELLEDGKEQSAIPVKESALRIEETARKARDIIDIFEQSRGPPTATELSDLLERCIDTVDGRYPAVRIDSQDVPDSISVDGTLQTVFVNVLDNAAKHNDAADPRVEVSVEEHEETVTVEIADNGPGIDNYERSAIERGTEGPLEHGSGLGLWLIRWGTEIAGGDVEFRDRNPSGTVVSIAVPILDRTIDSGIESIPRIE